MRTESRWRGLVRRLGFFALVALSAAPAARAHDRSDVVQLSRRFQDLVRSSHEEDRGYVFDPKVLAELARAAAGMPIDGALDQLQKALVARYGEHVAPSRHWIFNDAGAALGQLTLLHCSTKEYLIFFGTPIGTEGFSGRYRDVEFWDFVLQGQMLTYAVGETAAHVFNPGEFGYMGGNQGKGYRLVGPTWMLEYGRGSILNAFDFGVISAARFISRDWDSAWEQIYDCGKLAIGEIFGHRSRQAESW